MRRAEPAGEPRDLFHEYDAMLADRALFERALASTCATPAGGQPAAAPAHGVNLHTLFLLLDVAVEMMAEAGLVQVLGVHKAVKRHASVHFERCLLWQTCHLSGLSARGCLKLADGVFVHPQHEKFVLALWLCLHLREQERGRDAVPAQHAAVYWAATRCVVEQLQGAYAHMADVFKKNKVFACAEGGERA